MIEAHTQAILQDVVARESRSLLSYIGDAYPWTTAAGESRLAALRGAVEQEAAAVMAVGKFLQRNRISPPPLGQYPSRFTSWNFIALDYLAPALVEAERRSIAELEADLKKVAEKPARDQLSALLEVKRQTLTTLEGLQSPGGAPSVTTA